MEKERVPFRVAVFFHDRQKVSLLELDKKDFETLTTCCTTIVRSNTPKNERPLLACWLFQDENTYPWNVKCLESIDMKCARKSLAWDTKAQIVVL